MTEAVAQRALVVVEKMIAAWHALDTGAILSLFAEDGKLQSMMREPYCGKAAIGEMLDYVFTFTTRVKMEVINLSAKGNVVTLERRDLITARGRSGVLPAVGIIEIEDDLIVEWREYYDWETYISQFG